jgi:hypothetical protein
LILLKIAVHIPFSSESPVGYSEVLKIFLPRRKKWFITIHNG